MCRAPAQAFASFVRIWMSCLLDANDIKIDRIKSHLRKRIKASWTKSLQNSEREREKKKFNWKYAVSWALCESIFIELSRFAFMARWFNVTTVIESNQTEPKRIEWYIFIVFLIRLTMWLAVAVARNTNAYLHTIPAAITIEWCNSEHQKKNQQMYDVRPMCFVMWIKWLNDISGMCRYRHRRRCCCFVCSHARANECVLFYGLILFYFSEDVTRTPKPWQYFNWLRFIDTLTCFSYFYRCIIIYQAFMSALAYITVGQHW